MGGAVRTGSASAQAAIRRGITYPRGFEAAGVHAGIKRRRPDVAVIRSTVPAAAAAMFTTNRVQAAPIVVSREQLERSGGWVRAVVINSGNANACTGPKGVEDARAMIGACALALDIQAHEVLVASTGVIGVPLPLDAALEGISRACGALSPGGAEAAAMAILTTDRRAKEIQLDVPLSGGRIACIGGMAKGSGMIHPNMATMLAFVATDAPVAPDDLSTMLHRVVDATFHLITVDGDTSTNDMVVLMANGQAGGEPIRPGSDDFARLEAGIERACSYLAKDIARDGEGATRLIEVRVLGASSDAEARVCARAIAGSSLVKSAVHGRDPNWGRIAAAAGYSGARMDPAAFRVWMGDVAVARDGREVPFDVDAAREALGAEEVRLTIDLGTGGPGSATAWGCDMSEEYVRINASYRS